MPSIAQMAEQLAGALSIVIVALVFLGLCILVMRAFAKAHARRQERRLHALSKDIEKKAA